MDDEWMKLLVERKMMLDTRLSAAVAFEASVMSALASAAISSYAGAVALTGGRPNALADSYYPIIHAKARREILNHAEEVRNGFSSSQNTNNRGEKE